MESSTLRCAYSQCEIEFPPKALAPRKRFCSTGCRTRARTERMIKQGQLEILMALLQEVIAVPRTYSYAEGRMRTVVQNLKTELE